jgi:hypothetical protein
VKLSGWPCPQPDGTLAPELALSFDHARPRRLLVLPALFDEANRMRRFTLEVLRRLDAAGIDSLIPDLPGCNESAAPLDQCDLALWRQAAAAAAAHFGATHLLAIRGGGLLLPERLPGWHYGAVKGASILRQMLRARILSAREAGREEDADGLLDRGLREGIELGGYGLGAQLIGELQDALPPERAGLVRIEQELLGGSPLWLRAEPDEDRAQADALAAVIAVGMAG